MLQWCVYKSAHRLVTLLDEMYYSLYYAVDITWRRNKSNCSLYNPVIPAPHVYFCTYIPGADVQGAELGVFEEWADLNAGSGSGSSNSDKKRKHAESNSPSTSSNQGSVPIGNPLLQLQHARWMEGAKILQLKASWLPQLRDYGELCGNSRPIPADSQDGSNVPTMKGQDPMLPPVLRQWVDSARVWACHIYAFATPSQEALRRLCRFPSLVEIGAGTGYWASLLRAQGATVHAYDKDPPGSHTSGAVNSYHGKVRPWTQVLPGGVEKLASHPAATLLLCYPPPDSDMGLQAVRAYTGQTIAYVGEWQGDTGTPTREKLLLQDYRCVERVRLPNWTDTCYSLMIWERRTQGSVGTAPGAPLHAVHPFQCSTCGGSGRHVYRCRLTCHVYFCSDECAAGGYESYLRELSYRLMLPPGNALPAASSAPGDGDAGSVTCPVRVKSAQFKLVYVPKCG